MFVLYISGYINSLLLVIVSLHLAKQSSIQLGDWCGLIYSPTCLVTPAFPFMFYVILSFCSLWGSKLSGSKYHVFQYNAKR